MLIRTTDANGIEFSGDAPHLDDSIIAALNTFELSKKKVKDRIDNLDISSDSKFMLHSLVDKTIEVVVDTGKVVIWIGRKILEVVIFVGRHFPNATFGMLLGAVLGILIASIPIIGWLLGGIAPLLAILGLSLGAIEDFKQALARDPRVREVFSQFDSLRTI
ncbi:MAG: hypothetical protein F4Y80_17380 [Caldilineaceae bacterium SB0665_bin_21]|nr:hypothetical protein [Caldilineaceae bacterium SB0665_bin_21]